MTERSLAATARPFPWSTLDSTTRSEAQGFRALRCWASSQTRLGDLAGALAATLETRVEFLLRRVDAAEGARAIDDGAGVIVAKEGSAVRALGGGVFLEAEGALAAALVSRALRRSAPAVVDLARPSTPSIAGALASIVAATSRRAATVGPLRVLAAGPSPALLADFTRATPDLLVVSITVLVGDDAYVARAFVPRVETIRAPPEPLTRKGLLALGEVMLALPIVASSATAKAGDVAALRVGDAWMPGNLRIVRGTSGTFAGGVHLAASALERGVSAELHEDGHLVLIGGVVNLVTSAVESVALSEEERMPDNEDADALVEAVGEVPIVVRVEIGAAQMRAREWASLGKGDVIALGRRVAEPVVLRVGGVAVARGELVEIEGEVGVRVVDRLDQDRTSTAPERRGQQKPDEAKP